MRALLRHPLAQFLGLGAVFFALAPPAERPDTVQLPTGWLSALKSDETRRLGVSRLSAEQEQAVVDRAVDEELLYREALRLGIDRTDPLVRRRLVEKAIFLAEDAAGAGRVPSEADVRAFYEAHRERYRVPAAVAFHHVFASTLHGLAQGAGEPFVLGDTFPLQSVPQLAATFGADFAAAVEAGADGPVRSKFGWHRVEVTRRVPEHPATLDEVRARVRLELLDERKRSAVARMLEQARRRYEIQLVDAPFIAPPPQLAELD